MSRYADICSAIQNPVTLAGQLLQAQLISNDIYKNVCSPGLRCSDQVSTLMRTVQSRINLCADNLYVFIEVLDKDPTMSELSNQLKEEWLKGISVTTLFSLLIIYITSVTKFVILYIQL